MDLSTVVALATVSYMVFTGLMWMEMRRTNQRLDRPNIQVILEPGRRWGSLFELAVTNAGNAAVYDVRLDVTPDDTPGLSGKLKDLNLFNKPIPVLTERQEIRTIAFFYGNVIKLEQRYHTISFSVKYKTADGKEHVQAYTYDLGVYYDLPSSADKTLKDVTEELKGIREQLRSLTPLVKGIEDRLEWSFQPIVGHLVSTADLSIVLEGFASAWADFRSLGDSALVGFSFYKMRALCEQIHDRLCLSDERDQARQQMREKLFKMVRIRFLIDGGKSAQEFLALGDEVVALIEKTTRSQAQEKPVT